MNNDDDDANINSDLVDDEPESFQDFMWLVGKSVVFPDGDKIEVMQIKRRDSGPWITFHITQGPGIPRK